MRRSTFFTALIFAIGTAAPASAEVAPFGCDAGTGQTCYFRIYYTAGVARMVQMTAGTKTSVPDVDIGRARYCGSVGKPPPPKCSRKLINANYNN
jgi:hypothetical protein